MSLLDNMPHECTIRRRVGSSGSMAGSKETQTNEQTTVSSPLVLDVIAADEPDSSAGLDIAYMKITQLALMAVNIAGRERYNVQILIAE